MTISINEGAFAVHPEETSDGDAETSHWLWLQHDQIAEINPKKPTLDDSLQVSFIPMGAVEEESGRCSLSETRSFGEVKKGYTCFSDGDIIFAKITPCMENGKAALLDGLTNGIGFGSTEFHVSRLPEAVNKKFYFYFFVSRIFRKNAQANMSGSAGQLRVPTDYFKKVEVPLCPANEQHRIVAKIEQLFSEIDSGVESLKIAQIKLKSARQSLLKAAFEGKLTEQWRKENADQLESPEALLERIQAERETHYQQQLANWKQQASEWEANGKEGKKPRKPKTPKALPPLTQEELAELPALPEGWGWVRYGDLCAIVRNGISQKPSGSSGDRIFRISAVRPMRFDLNDYRFIDNGSGQYNDYYLEQNDLVFTRYNGSRNFVGVSAIFNSSESFLFPDKLVQTRFFSSKTLPEYFQYATNSGASRRALEKKIRTTAGQSGISGSDIKAMPVPLCSVKEQERISTLLSSRLSQFDQLEKTLAASLKQAEALKQSILKRAFAGKLVPQDPNDEPASELLACIRAERIHAEREHQPKTRRRMREESAP